MGIEEVNGEELIRCQCGNLVTSDNRQEPCGENGVEYKAMINDLTLGIIAMDIESIEDPTFRDSIHNLLSLANETTGGTFQTCQTGPTGITAQTGKGAKE